MSGFSLLLLFRAFDPESAIECVNCDGLFDLRFWAIEGEEMECPECGAPSVVEEVIARQSQDDVL